MAQCIPKMFAHMSAHTSTPMSMHMCCTRQAVPHRAIPHRSAPCCVRRVTPHRVALNRTAPCCPYRAVPYACMRACARAWPSCWLMALCRWKWALLVFACPYAFLCMLISLYAHLCTRPNTCQSKHGYEPLCTCLYDHMSVHMSIHTSTHRYTTHVSKHISYIGSSDAAAMAAHSWHGKPDACRRRCPGSASPTASIGTADGRYRHRRRCV